MHKIVALKFSPSISSMRLQARSQSIIANRTKQCEVIGEDDERERN